MAANTQSFEKAVEELEMILEEMASDDTSLDDSVKMYAKAAKLVQLCNSRLEKAKVKITEIDQKLLSMEEKDDL